MKLLIVLIALLWIAAGGAIGIGVALLAGLGWALVAAGIFMMASAGILRMGLMSNG